MNEVRRTDPVPDSRDLRAEEWRLAWLRYTVHRLSRTLEREPLSYEDAVERVGEVRRAILSRFPTKGEVYDLVYAPRFRRMLEERFGRAPRERVIRL
jgi:hypothetical protein